MKTKIQVTKMSCQSCVNKIETTFKNKKGIHYVKANLKHQQVELHFDEKIVSILELNYALEKLGYPTEKINLKKRRMQVLEIILILIMGGMVLTHLPFDFTTSSIKEGSSLLAIFLIGIFSSFHCISMCGGFSLAQTAKSKNPLQTSYIYHSGRILTYTILGMGAGLIGGWFQLTPKMQALFYMVAAILMVYMGITQLEIFPKLPKIQLLHYKSKQKESSTFMAGMLNGLLPCGPLQVILLFALTTSSMWVGGLTLLFYGVGTSPLLIGFGSIATLFKGKRKEQFILWSGCLILVLGLSMGQNALALAGIGKGGSNYQKAIVENGIQKVEGNLEVRAYPSIVVEAGMPVEFIINVAPLELNGCNNRLVVPEFNIEQTLYVGENIISFVPTQKGEYTLTCWMGMIRASIKVI